jgi:hypothetical protein
MSEVRRESRGALARARVAIATSLALGGIAMSTTGCLITSTPQFKARQHTAPFLDAATAQPDWRAVVIVDKSKPTTPSFSASVISQDDPPDSNGLFQKVYSVLYIDYGIEAEPNRPFLHGIAGSTTDLGTLDPANPRTVTATWYPNVDAVGPGCHTATLMVSHIFDYSSLCPACAGDSSSITWQVLSCDSSMPGSCDDLPVAKNGACAYQLDPNKTATCASVERDGGIATTCPDAVDAGAP